MNIFLKALGNTILEQRMMIFLYSMSIFFLIYSGSDVITNFDSIGSMSYSTGGRHGEGFYGGGFFLIILLSAVAFLYFTFTLPKELYNSIREKMQQTKPLANPKN